MSRNNHYELEVVGNLQGCVTVTVRKIAGEGSVHANHVLMKTTLGAFATIPGDIVSGVRVTLLTRSADLQDIELALRQGIQPHFEDLRDPDVPLDAFVDVTMDRIQQADEAVTEEWRREAAKYN